MISSVFQQVPGEFFYIVKETVVSEYLSLVTSKQVWFVQKKLPYPLGLVSIVGLTVATMCKIYKRDLLLFNLTANGKFRINMVTSFAVNVIQQQETSFFFYHIDLL